MQTETLRIAPSASPSFRYGAEITLPAPPALVWAIVSDYRRDAEWREGVRVRPEPTGPSLDGTRTFETLQLFGDVHRVTARVLDVDRGRSLRFRSEDGLVEGLRRVTPVAGGARFELEVEVRVEGLQRAVAPILSAHFEGRVRRDLARLAAVVEEARWWEAASEGAQLERFAVPTVVGPLRVQRVGDAGPVVLLWHSAFLDARSFWPLVPRLAEGRTLLLVDGPGHGGSPLVRRPYTLEDCADAALDVLDHFGVASAHFIGHAWGGHVGVTLAARRTQRLESLALISSPLAALRARERLTAHLAALALRTAGVGAVRGLLLETMLGDATRARRPEVVAYVSTALRSQGGRGASRTVRSALLGRPSLVDRLGRVEVPALVVATDDDPSWPVEVARAHASRLPNARFEVVRGARHLPLLEATEETRTLLGSWLASVRSGA